MKSRKLLLSLAVFFLVGAFAPMKASPVVATDGENDEPEAKGWVSIGPDNVAGRVRAIIFDKFNDGVMYAGPIADAAAFILTVFFTRRELAIMKQDTLL